MFIRQYMYTNIYSYIRVYIHSFQSQYHEIDKIIKFKAVKYIRIHYMYIYIYIYINLYITKQKIIRYLYNNHNHTCYLGLSPLPGMIACN